MCGDLSTEALSLHSTSATGFMRHLPLDHPCRGMLSLEITAQLTVC